MEQIVVSHYLLFLLIDYYFVHIPFDVFMLITRNKCIPIEHYGINSSNRILAILGITSLIMWISWFSFGLFQLNNRNTVINQYFQLKINNTYFNLIQQIALLIITIGVIIAIWVRIVRGRYSPSWGLNSRIPLIQTGPYRFIRHPTYLFYFLMFIGLPLITMIWPLLLNSIGIYGYTKSIRDEEELLIQHFGEKYEKYQLITKKFVPFLW